MPRLEIGEKTALNVTLKARHRVMAGLSWDPASGGGFFSKNQTHDLDLAAYVFTPDGAFIEHVSGEPGRNVDLSEKIYHSGDNTDGSAEGDDEEISAELRDIPPFIDHIIFCVLVRGGANFGEIAAPEIRLADGYTNYNFLQNPLNHESGKAMNAYVFARLYRTSLSESGWGLHYISRYENYAGQGLFAEGLKEYLI